MANIPALRESLLSWISHCDDDAILSLHRVRRNMDSNIRIPLAPPGWVPIHRLAAANKIDAGHLARMCREVYAPQDQAKKFCLNRRQTWHLAQSLAETLAPCERQETAALPEVIL